MSYTAWPSTACVTCSGTTTSASPRRPSCTAWSGACAARPSRLEAHAALGAVHEPLVGEVSGAGHAGDDQQHRSADQARHDRATPGRCREHPLLLGLGAIARDETFHGGPPREELARSPAASQTCRAVFTARQHKIL